MNRSTELERIASGCKYDGCWLFDYILCEAELYAVEIATLHCECNDNRIFTEILSVSIALMKRD